MFASYLCLMILVLCSHTYIQTHTHTCPHQQIHPHMHIHTTADHLWIHTFPDTFPLHTHIHTNLPPYLLLNLSKHLLGYQLSLPLSTPVTLSLCLSKPNPASYVLYTCWIYHATLYLSTYWHSCSLYTPPRHFLSPCLRKSTNTCFIRFPTPAESLCCI